MNARVIAGKNPPLVGLSTRDSVMEGTPSAFETIDEIVRSTNASGVQVVEGNVGVRRALADHIARRARSVGRRWAMAARPLTDDPWHALAVRLGIQANADPLALAGELCAALEDSIVVIDDPRPSAWNRAIIDGLDRAISDVELGPAPLVVLLTERGPDRVRPVLEIDAKLDAADRRRFIEALVEDEVRDLPSGAASLSGFDQWWRGRPGIEARAAGAELDGAARALLRRLLLARRPWPIAELGRLGDATALAPLIELRLIEASADHVWVRELEVGDSCSEDAALVAGALVELGRSDPWARMRASELCSIAGDAERAEAEALAAIALAEHVELRRDFWARYRPDGEALLRAAEVALGRGDSEWALSFARRGIAGNSESFQAVLVLGRAEAARGDLSAARAVLRRALSASSDAEQHHEAAAHLAEVAYLAGNLDDARSLAEQATTSSRAATRLFARNVLGKLLLAAARWDEAEAHFAEDAYRAAIAGEHVAELRANLNRGIVNLSRCRYDEARSILSSVQESGERLGEWRAVAHALTNLAVLATLRHEYAEALSLGERAIEARRAIGESIPLSRAVLNLAALRLRVGLVDEAEQALAFGRAACGANLPAAHASECALVAARVHLARGRTLQARAELDNALRTAEASNSEAMACECHITAARAALEDGDVSRAALELERARPSHEAPARYAEVALLFAIAARASGEPFEQLALDARRLAQRANHPELLREVHVLLHHARQAAGDSEEAEKQLELAVKYRDDVAGALPEGLRARYLAKRELDELRRLELRPAPSMTNERSPAARAGVFRTRMLVGESPRIAALRAAIQKVGTSDATVLVLGESGTGKELVAEALHTASRRQRGPLVKVNCAALAESLLLSELFGHEKGAFTGALARRLGRFEIAHGGTLFLDEIGDISPATQVALLRVLQERTFERVGGAAPITVDVRVIAATHRDLARLVELGQFREDLYYRLCGIVLEVPPLRSVREDLRELARALLARIAEERGEPAKRLDAAALELLASHDWPGNVRELENALRTASVFAEGETIQVEDLRENVDSLRDVRPSSRRVLAAPAAAEPDPGALIYDHIRTGVALGDMKRQLERACIERALGDSNGNITRAASLLGMKRPRLSQLVKKYQLLADDSEET